MSENELVLALRAFTELVEADPGKGKRKRRRRRVRDDVALILDTETTIDAIQGLTFGSYRYCRRKRKGLRCVEVGVFYRDNLPLEQLVLLREYVTTNKADVVLGGRRNIRLLSLSEFLAEVFYPAAYRSRGLVVGFNLPFDLSRVAADAGEGRNRYRGGFSLIPWVYKDATGKVRENPQRPRVGLRVIDSKRAFIEFLPPMRGAGRDRAEGSPVRHPVFRGRFLDLRTLVFALTNESHSLASACRIFNVEHGKGQAPEHGVITPEYITYNLRDVLATQELLEKVMAEFQHHPIRLDATKAWSPAAIAKAYLEAMGLTPPAIQFTKVSAEFLGITMTAYYGGQAEARIRKVNVPVVHCDFLSMYPTVNTLMGLWRFLTAERLDLQDATEEVQTWLAGITVERCFEPSFWAELPVFALVEPRDEILPARARYSEGEGGFNIGVNPLRCRTPLWFAGPDLVKATLLSGRAPHVIRAVRVVPVGIQRKLRHVRLRGTIEIDPARQDFFQHVIEARQRAKANPSNPEEAARLDGFLKVVANAGAYGVFAEMNRGRLPIGEEAEIAVFGLDGEFTAHTNGPEEPGEYCFPPIAALIPAAARLMLGLLEHCVTKAGGTYAMCDTDSMAIVANEQGGRVRCPSPGVTEGSVRKTVSALSWSQVQAIVDRFAALNPYDREAVPGSILKVEKENFALDANGKPTGPHMQLFCYAISAKRYALFNLSPKGEVVIRKGSEHGLGHLLNPLAVAESGLDDRDWITRVWDWIIRRALGQHPAALPFANRVAVSRYTISTPLLWRPFLGPRWELPYQDRVKPMNFVLSAHVAPLGHPVGTDPKRFHLIAPYNPDPRTWASAIWTDIHSRKQFGVTTSGAGSHRLVRVRTYGDLIREYLAHPEAKSLGPDGRPCGPNTVGLLRRRPVEVILPPIYIGKESNQLEEVEQGQVHDLEEVQEIYVDHRQDPWRSDALPVLKLIPAVTLAKATGLSVRAIKAIRNGHSMPRPENRRVLLEAAVRHARRITADLKAVPEAHRVAKRLLSSVLMRDVSRSFGSKTRQAGR